MVGFCLDYRRSLPVVYRRLLRRLRRVLRRLPPTFKLLDSALTFVLFFGAFTLLFDRVRFALLFDFGTFTLFGLGVLIVRVRFCRFTPNVDGAFGVFDVFAPISI